MSLSQGYNISGIWGEKKKKKNYTLIRILGITPITKYWIYSCAGDIGLHISVHILAADCERSKGSSPQNKIRFYFLFIYFFP